MKTLFTILLICAISFVFSGVIIELSETIQLNNKIDFYMNEGYTAEASEHIAKVEFKIIPEDSLYIAYMED